MASSFPLSPELAVFTSPPTASMPVAHRARAAPLAAPLAAPPAARPAARPAAPPAAQPAPAAPMYVVLGSGSRVRYAPLTLPGSSEPRPDKPSDLPAPGSGAGSGAGSNAGGNEPGSSALRSLLLGGRLARAMAASESATESAHGAHAAYAVIPPQAFLSGAAPFSPFFVGVAGGIGAGKTTLARGLAKLFQSLLARAFLEQPMSSALELFYQDPARNALDLQVQLIEARQTLRETAKASGAAVAIFDRTPEEEELFIHLLHARKLLRDDTAASLCALVRRWCRANPFDLVFGHCANAEICLARQQKRNRRGETVDAGYMHELCSEYHRRASVLYPACAYHELSSDKPFAEILAEAARVLAERLNLVPEQAAEILARVDEVAAEIDHEAESENEPGREPAPEPPAPRAPEQRAPEQRAPKPRARNSRAKKIFRAVCGIAAVGAAALVAWSAHSAGSDASLIPASAVHASAVPAARGF